MGRNLIDIVKATLATLFYIIGIELIGSWFYVAELLKIKNYNDYYFLIQGILQFIAVTIFICSIKKTQPHKLIKQTHYKWYLMAFILGISFVFMQTPLKWLYNLLFGTNYEIIYRFDGFLKLKNIKCLSFILFIPIGEELFFRKYIQNGLQNKMNALLAIVATSFLFALIHAPYLNLILESSNQDWHLFYLTIFGGGISGLIYYKSNSVGPSIIFHIFWNLMVIIV